MEENGLMNLPRQLYDCNETFLSLDYAREKAVTLKNTKYVMHNPRELIDLSCIHCRNPALVFSRPNLIVSKLHKFSRALLNVHFPSPTSRQVSQNLEYFHLVLIPLL